MIQQNINLIVLEPEEGYTLTNGEIYSKRVYLGIHDSPNNWHEIPDDEVPIEEEEELLSEDSM